MPTKHPRVNVTVNEEMLGLLSIFAQREHKTISAAAADMIQMGLELQEDLYFSTLSERRLREGGKAVSHKNAWK